MRRVELSPEAEADLLDIALYIAADDPARALSIVDELQARCAAVADFPDRGRSHAGLAERLRSVPHGRHVIFSTAGADVVRIERILPGARELEGEFE